MARMTASHKTQIIIALITLVGGIAVAVLTSWDKLFPPARSAGGNQAVEVRAAAPVALDAPQESLERLKASQEAVLNRGAGALEDITRQIDAQSANLQGR